MEGTPTANQTANPESGDDINDADCDTLDFPKLPQMLECMGALRLPAYILPNFVQWLAAHVPLSSCTKQSNRVSPAISESRLFRRHEASTFFGKTLSFKKMSNGPISSLLISCFLLWQSPASCFPPWLLRAPTEPWHLLSPSMATVNLRPVYVYNSVDISLWYSPQEIVTGLRCGKTQS